MRIYLPSPGKEEEHPRALVPKYWMLSKGFTNDHLFLFRKHVPSFVPMLFLELATELQENHFLITKELVWIGFGHHGNLRVHPPKATHPLH